MTDATHDTLMPDSKTLEAMVSAFYNDNSTDDRKEWMRSALMELQTRGYWLASRGQWRAIADAPRDGTLILLYDGADQAWVGSWRKSHAYHKEQSAERWRPYPASKIDDQVYIIATHWKPLPPPPSEKG